jgi:predicted RNA-binding Zn ribbon-like protein
MAPAPGDQFDLSGGDLCLDFANTLSGRQGARREHLSAWPDLVAWGEQAGLLSSGDAARLRAAARRHGALSARQFRRALALRECLYRVFSATAAGQRPSAADLRDLNAWIGRTMRHARLVEAAGGFAWGWSWSDGRSPFDRILWPIVKSAADWLASPGVHHVRECASETCTWLFVDRSRTKHRRWCSMQTCGNRAKARRFYARRRGSPDPAVVPRG